MAITTTTIKKSAGWARTDVIDQLEKAFEWLGFHGGTRIGTVIGISSYSGGGTVSGSSAIYQDIFPISTTGIGTGSSFRVERSSGINRVYVNRPGYGYTAGEVVTLSSEDIGGSSNGATNLQIKVTLDGTISNSVGYSVTFTDTYVTSGIDRNGIVSGGNTTITIREGDTLNLVNNMSSGLYQLNICWSNDALAGNNNRVFNVINQNATSGGGICTWTPKPGQRGDYFIKDDNYSNAAAVKIVVTPADPADISYTGVGSTSTFYDKQIPSGATNPWGVLRHEIQPNKKFGSTYRGFQLTSDTNIRFHVGSEFNASNDPYVYDLNGTAGYPNRFAGASTLDFPLGLYENGTTRYFGSSFAFEDVTYQASETFATSVSYDLDLNVYRSSLDPKFAVLSFRQPTLSSLRLRDNTFVTFILHNFTTDVWDLNHVFLSGVTFIRPNSDDNIPYLSISPVLAGERYYQSNWGTNSAFSRRSAESGYLQYTTPANSNSISNYGKEDRFYPNSMPSVNDTTFSMGIYLRNNSPTSHRAEGMPSEANYNAVIKGIPLSAKIIPCPYYMPDDFVLIDFDYTTPSANIQQGDTITISESEVYTVIQGSYNQTTRTRGILFCARTV